MGRVASRSHADGRDENKAAAAADMMEQGLWVALRPPPSVGDHREWSGCGAAIAPEDLGFHVGKVPIGKRSRASFSLDNKLVVSYFAAVIPRLWTTLIRWTQLF